MKNTITFSERFRGYMPVVIDVETGGFNHTSDALLEIAAVFIKLDKNGNFVPGNIIHNHIIHQRNIMGLRVLLLYIFAAKAAHNGKHYVFWIMDS